MAAEHVPNPAPPDVAYTTLLYLQSRCGIVLPLRELCTCFGSQPARCLVTITLQEVKISVFGLDPCVFSFFLLQSYCLRHLHV